MLFNTTVAVLVTADGFTRLVGNPILTSLDGGSRASLYTVLHDSWTDTDRAGFGIYIVDTTPPEGKRWTGAFEDDDGTPAPVFEDIPPPNVISDRQFAQQLAVLGTITWEEAISWAARGELPDAMEAAVAALPEEERNPARMLLSSATTYERSHPLVPMLGAILSYDAAELDDLWRAAAVL
jgi:hypothetical protein